MKRLLSSFLLLACSASPSEEPSGVLVTDKNRADASYDLSASEFRDTCAATAGEACRACKASEQAREDLCWDTCTDLAIHEGSTGCVSSCERVTLAGGCDYLCHAPADECSTRSLVFELTGVPDDQLLLACNAAGARDQSCNERQTGRECEVYARVERSEARAFYECVAATPCGEDASACVQLPAEGFGAVVQAQCPSDALEPALLDKLDWVGDWVHDDMRMDAAICADLYCGHPTFAKCLQAWFDAVTGR